MAKKKTPRPRASTGQVLSRLQSNMKRLQREGERLLGQTRKQASQLISRDQRRALDRLVSQAQRLRTDLEKRAQRASKEVESRAEQFLSTIEKQAAKRLGPLLRRLDVPSRQELNTLSRRIAQLERRLSTSRGSAAASTATDASPAEAGTSPMAE